MFLRMCHVSLILGMVCAGVTMSTIAQSSQHQLPGAQLKPFRVDPPDDSEVKNFGECKDGGCEIGVRLDQYTGPNPKNQYSCQSTSLQVARAKGWFDNKKNLQARTLVWRIVEREDQIKVRFRDPGLKVKTDTNECTDAKVKDLKLEGALGNSRKEWTVSSKFIQDIIKDGSNNDEAKRKKLNDIPRIECHFDINLEFSDDNQKTWKQCEPIDPVVVNKD